MIMGVLRNELEHFSENFSFYRTYTHYKNVIAVMNQKKL